MTPEPRVEEDTIDEDAEGDDAVIDSYFDEIIDGEFGDTFGGALEEEDE